jgi:cytochrome c oxidase assembly protein subunit 11
MQPLISKSATLIGRSSSSATSRGSSCAISRRWLSQEAATAGKNTQQSAQNRSYEYYKKKSESSWWTRRRSNNNTRKLTREEGNIKVAWYASAVVIGAVGATYASVPLYKMFCQATGFGGTTQRVVFEGEAAEPNALEKAVRGFMNKIAPKSSARVHTWTDEDAAAKLASLRPVENAKLITVRFDTTVGDVMPWSFVPVQLDVKVVPGETALSFFRVTNHSDKAITGVATYNVHPPKVGLYFQKIQCFCFEEQRLLPGETVDMPVFFFIDPEILDDSQVSYISDMTLSYTFFQTDEDEEDDE